MIFTRDFVIGENNWQTASLFMHYFYIISFCLNRKYETIV